MKLFRSAYLLILQLRYFDPLLRVHKLVSSVSLLLGNGSKCAPVRVTDFGLGFCSEGSWLAGSPSAGCGG